MKNKLNLTEFKRIKNLNSSPTVNYMKLINLLIKKGNKNKSINLFLKVLEQLKINFIKINIQRFIINTLYDIEPFAELKTIKLGSTKYLVPTPLIKTRRLSIASNLLIKNAKNRTDKSSIHAKLVNEILDTNLKKSETYKQSINFNNLIYNNIQNIKFCKL